MLEGWHVQGKPAIRLKQLNGENADALAIPVDATDAASLSKNATMSKLPTPACLQCFSTTAVDRSQIDSVRTKLETEQGFLPRTMVNASPPKKHTSRRMNGKPQESRGLALGLTSRSQSTPRIYVLPHLGSQWSELGVTRSRIAHEPHTNCDVASRPSSTPPGRRQERFHPATPSHYYRSPAVISGDCNDVTEQATNEQFGVLTASYDGSAKLFNPINGECQRTFQSSRISMGFVTSAVFSPDAQQVLAAPFKFEAKRFQLNTGLCEQTYRGHSGLVNAASFSSDGTRVLTASRDHTAKVFSAETANCECTMVGHSSSVNTSAFSHDCRLVVTASGDHTSKLFAVETGECMLTLSGHDAWICSAAFSFDGSQAVTSSKDGCAKVFDVCTGACHQTFADHRDILTSATFSPDAQLVLTTSRDALARIFDTRTGLCVRTLSGHRIIINSATFSPSGSQVLTASSDCTAKLYDVGSSMCEQTLVGHRAAVSKAVFATSPF